MDYGCDGGLLKDNFYSKCCYFGQDKSRESFNCCSLSNGWVFWYKCKHLHNVCACVYVCVRARMCGYEYISYLLDVNIYYKL